ncbi:hypothetical protein GALMADRAFT_217504 [Galerina marginata CBS 339.88]|uniref:Uncharacterized protein n=1 Tax=Galerina marginata (strain CBS 339.88) TaxID=685588 RepID=A0A067S3Y5_GALM3|nr:hypothetical protein GALMADRAFT_217504 [Galerina marginata CBS 339.88]
MKNSTTQRRSNKPVARIPVTFEAPADALGNAGPSVEREIIMVREMGQQRSTGRTYRSKPTAVVDDPWLANEDAEIGLDLDSVEADQAFNADFADIEEAATNLKEEKNKKKKRTLASVGSASQLLITSINFTTSLVLWFYGRSRTETFILTKCSGGRGVEMHGLQGRPRVLIAVLARLKNPQLGSIVVRSVFPRNWFAKPAV